MLSINTQAQDFDQSFLESLPNDIKDDLQKRTLEKQELEKPQYRRPSSYILKPNKSSNRYGSSIFSLMQTTLMPLNEPNFDGNYVLDFGDVLELQLTGQESSISQLAIKRDGSINIQDVGKVYVAGLSLSDSVALIKSKISSKFLGVEAFISLTNIRDIQIIVAGNVYNPGPYTLSGNSNMFHALSVSGGPSEMGSFRVIELIRDNEVIEVVDLYKTFIYGKSNFSTRLRSGDLIFIKPITNMISIQGAVKRPGRYELLDSDNLGDTIFFANGLTNYADLREVSLLRIVNGTILKKKIYTLDELDNAKPQDEDRIFIRKFPLRFVQIDGAVKNPGSYIINEGDGILELVNQSGGYLEHAYPFGGILENRKAKEINILAKQKLYESFLDNLVEFSMQNSADTSFTVSLLAELNNSQTSGRLIARFDLEQLENDPNLDIILQNGDKITIPEFLDQIYVFGEIASEGSIKFNSSKNIEDYIKQKGGFTKSADKKEIFVLQPNGETFRLSSKNIFQREKLRIELYPGSVIFIPIKGSSSALVTQTAQAYAAILGNIGVTLASISVLKD